MQSVKVQAKTHRLEKLTQTNYCVPNPWIILGSARTAYLLRIGLRYRLLSRVGFGDVRNAGGAHLHVAQRGVAQLRQAVVAFCTEGQRLHYRC